MATPIQENLEKANAEYASKFTQGSLALPPAKKYLVRTSFQSYTKYPIPTLAKPI
jgi:hypothetical protein